MGDYRPHRTAYATAFMRAQHMLIDDAPPVLEDRLAVSLMRRPTQEILLSQSAWLKRWLGSWWLPNTLNAALRTQTVVRSRYAEDCLAEVSGSGCGRYVILGAGLDTFAWRQQNSNVDVLEIDHPATQRWKLELLQEQDIGLPDCLTLLPVDFERSLLSEVWPCRTAPDFISWLGTTYYLSKPAVKRTLVELFECTAPGSELVLDYWKEPMGHGLDLVLSTTRFVTASQGEPMRAFFHPQEIEQLAREAGWQVVEHCSASDQTDRYLQIRSDGLKVPSFAYLLRLAR